LQIAPNHGLSREEVAQMEADSFAHAKDDMLRHRVVDLVTNSKLDSKWTRDAMNRVGYELSDDVRAPLNHHLAALDALIAQAQADWRSVDPDQFAQAKHDLDEASVRLHEIAIAQSLRGEQATSPER
jgi:molecular chaperone DnaK (HSP70)